MKIIVFDSDIRYRSLHANRMLQIFIKSIQTQKLSLHLYLPHKDGGNVIDGIDHIKSPEEFNESDYDCMIVYDLESYIHSLTRFEHLPIVYIAVSPNSENQAFPHARLMRVVNVSLHSPDSFSLLIPKEFAVNLTLTLSGNYLQRSLSKHIRYIIDLDKESFNLENICTVINAINCFENTHLTIRCTKEIWSILKRISNRDTLFKSIDLQQNIDTDIDIAIVAGLRAAEYLLAGILVIPIGNKGLGSAIIPENVIEHAKDGFRGRIGGGIQEFIPLKLLLAEMSFCNSLVLANNGVQKKTYDLLSDYFLQIDKSKAFYNDIKLCLALWKKIQQKKIRQTIPRFVDGVDIKKNNKGGFNIYNRFKFLMAEIGDEEYLITKSFDDKKTLSEICSKFSSDSAGEIINFAIELYKAKLITLLEH